MDLFSISQLAQYSGVKPHTIRIWEKRYNALKPNRSEGNTRYYDNSQLRRLLNIVGLMDTEYKVSELCAMPDEKIFRLLEEWKVVTHSETAGLFVSQLIAAGMEYDEPRFSALFAQCQHRYGMLDTYLKVVYPMLVRIGLMWSCDTLPAAHEHFISNLLRQKLFSAIDTLPPAVSSPETWLLFLPENEFHEIGLLFAQYLIRLSGKKAIYLGANVPLISLNAALKDLSPDNLLLFLVHHDLPEDAQQYLDGIRTRFAGKKMFVAGSHALIGHLRTGKKIHWLQSVEDLESQLK
ncbi:MerR family transcriptional regulator [Flavitalea flava]